MSLFERLLALWTEPLPAGDGAVAAFHEAYADPVSMNGRQRRWAITLLPGEWPAPQRPPYVDAVFARDDVRPALVQAARFLR